MLVKNDFISLDFKNKNFLFSTFLNLCEKKNMVDLFIYKLSVFTIMCHFAKVLLSCHFREQPMQLCYRWDDMRYIILHLEIALKKSINLSFKFKKFQRPPPSPFTTYQCDQLIVVQFLLFVNSIYKPYCLRIPTQST